MRTNILVMIGVLDYPGYLLRMWTSFWFQKPEYGTWSTLIGIELVETRILGHVNTWSRFLNTVCWYRTWWLRCWEIETHLYTGIHLHHVYKEMNNQVSYAPCKHHIPKKIQTIITLKNRHISAHVNALTEQLKTRVKFLVCAHTHLANKPESNSKVDKCVSAGSRGLVELNKCECKSYLLVIMCFVTTLKHVTNVNRRVHQYKKTSSTTIPVHTHMHMVHLIN